MVRSPIRRLPPSEPAGTAGRTRVMQMELDAFADRLRAAMDVKRWSASELARQVWGELTTKQGLKVARNRDRISTYLKGKSWPDPQNLAAIARALEVKPEDLAPDILGSTVERQNPELAIVAVAGHPDKVHLKVNKLVNFAIATAIMQLLQPTDEGTPPSATAARTQFVMSGS